jgi:hypothetical protein
VGEVAPDEVGELEAEVSSWSLRNLSWVDCWAIPGEWKEFKGLDPSPQGCVGDNETVFVLAVALRAW